MLSRVNEIKVDILLEHYEGEENWTARVPLLENCLAEGSTPQEASKAIIPELEYFTHNQPQVLDQLKRRPKFILSEVTLPFENSNSHE